MAKGPTDGVPWRRAARRSFLARMSEEAVAVSATPDKAKKKTKSAAKKPKSNPPHPKVSEMVVAAIGSLKERGGSSLQAIKKHIASQHKVDMDRLTPFVKKYLKSAVANGTLVQTKGKGATGSFKMGAGGGKAADSKKSAVKKPNAGKARAPKKTKSAAGASKSPKKPKAAPKRKPAGARKTSAAPKKVGKATTKAVKPKSPKVKSMKKVAAKKSKRK